MDASAVVIHKPESLSVERLELTPPTQADVVVDIAFSGISTGTERLLWQGRMPPFPGMGYPLVPGYESVGVIAAAGSQHQDRIGQTVFVPGATCYGAVRGLFGGAASRIVLPASRAIAVEPEWGEKAVLLALAATAQHAVAGTARLEQAGTARAALSGAARPELIVGHGVVGRLIARLVIASGDAPPVVWETNPVRMGGATGYSVLHPEADPRKDYRCICDASGDANLLDTLVTRLAHGGEIVLAGFYAERLSFAFPMAFMREARLRIAAQWQPADLETVRRRIADGSLSLDGLITHRMPATQAQAAYQTAFGDAACLKMILDWRANA